MKKNIFKFISIITLLFSLQAVVSAQGLFSGGTLDPNKNHCYPDGCVMDKKDFTQSLDFTAFSSAASYMEAALPLQREKHGTVTTRDSFGRLTRIACGNGPTRLSATYCSPGETMACNDTPVTQYAIFVNPTDTKHWDDGKCPNGVGTTVTNAPGNTWNCLGFMCTQKTITSTCEERTITRQNCACAPTGSCSNLATNPPNCNVCPAGLSLKNGMCSCDNGAVNPNSCTTCPAGSSMVNNQCACDNGGDIANNCTQCPAGQTLHNGSCVSGCYLTNVCGQTVLGSLVNGVCENPVGVNINNTCIEDFKVSTQSIVPGGSVDFVWKVPKLQPNVSAKCGFVDLTTPTPRPIPGLQDLDALQDKARISKIQTTTRFCLVCQFTNTKTNQQVGDAVSHQWVRVIRIGEN